MTITVMSDDSPPLTLDLRLHHVCFNTVGRYFVKLSLTGSQEKQREVKLFINKSSDALRTWEHTTDPVLQTDPNEPLRFKDSIVTFSLPSGFANDEVILAAEAYALPEDPLKEGTICGRGSLTVYPHITSLFPIKIPPLSSSDDGGEVYSRSIQLVLTNENLGEGVGVNVGALKMDLVLKGIDEPKPQPRAKESKKKPAKVQQDNSAPGPSTSYQPDSVPPTPEPSSGVRTIPDPPLGSLVSPVHPRHLCGSYVAREGYREVAILVHAALSLPSKSNGRPPQPYVTGKSRKDKERKLQAQSVTHATIQPTHSPTWDELLLVEIPSDEAKQEELILSIADHPSREILTEYSIPMMHLKPLHQYHLELVQPNRDMSSDTRLYITLILKEDNLSVMEGTNPNMFGFEMLLRGLESPIANQLGPIIAVARVISHWKQYKENMLTVHPSPAGVTMTTINFPSPHPTSFSVAGSSLTYGAPQVTTCGEPQDQPQWNQMLFFPGDGTDLFTATGALVIEYYAASLAVSSSTWQLNGTIGYSHHSLDQFLLSNLQQENAKLGLKLDALPVEGSRLKTTVGATATVGLVLRLITKQRPDSLVAASHLSSLPAFRTGPAPVPGGTMTSQRPQDIHRTDQNPYGLPPLDAVKSLLPQFHSIYSAPSPAPVNSYHSLLPGGPQENTSSNTGRGDVRSPRTIPQELRNTMDMRTLALLDYQMKEVDRYRTAMRKLAADLLHLKQENVRLEEANSRLRRDLNQHDEISRLMIGSDDLDNVTQGELIQKFVLLKKKMADESTKRQQLQQRTQNLQNELIKKNEKEKERIKLLEAHESQQALLQKLQGKIQKFKTLQETCKKQEKVIVQLEQLLSKDGKSVIPSDGEDNQLNRTLSDENTRLREEIFKYKDMLEAAETKRPRESSGLRASGGIGDSERMELLQKLDRAEGRIFGLERQVTENARKWAKEKADLQMKLNEMTLSQQTGFKNSFSTQDLRKITESPTIPGVKRSYVGPRRPSPKLNPLDRR